MWCPLLQVLYPNNTNSPTLPEIPSLSPPLTTHSLSRSSQTSFLFCGPEDALGRKLANQGIILSGPNSARRVLLVSQQPSDTWPGSWWLLTFALADVEAAKLTYKHLPRWMTIVARKKRGGTPTPTPTCAQATGSSGPGQGQETGQAAASTHQAPQHSSI